ncbi:diguanylate cyclase [Musicola paradisiaca Ech703]|uniref:diguanylate cyclase n=1 Tax=Musicola paradisiaca (strain Ech703) TaxID=579405 RepID=C6CA62_MUSP7|nr:diguanylate cyclase [Musicola paradisiaca Ech703]
MENTRRIINLDNKNNKHKITTCMKIKKIHKVKLLHLILFISIFSTFITLLNSYYSIYDVQKKLITEQSYRVDLNYSNKLASTVDNFINTSIEQLTYSAGLIEHDVHYGNISSLEKNTQKIHRISNRFNSVVVVNHDGVILATSPPELNLAGIRLTSSASKTALESKQPFVSPPYTSIVGNYLIFISVPIYSNSGDYLGYIGGTIYLNNRYIINNFMSTQFSNEGHNTYVIDREGVIIYHYDTARVGGKFDDINLLDNTFQQDKGNFMMLDEQNILSPAGFARSKSTGWLIITQQSFHSLKESLNSVMLSVLKTGLPLVLLTLLLLTVLAVYISRPLRQLAKSASTMEDFNVISKIRAVNSWYQEAEQLKRVLLIGTVLLHKRIGRLSSEAHTDPLNRRGMQESMEELRNEYKKIAVIAVDIDHFKQINDTFGHDTGDDVIRKLSQLFRQNFRKTDLICRIGGEEFLILLPGADIHIATIIAERLRNNVANASYLPNAHPVTISIGVTTFNPQTSPLDKAIKIADNALYKAKKGGRNKVMVSFAKEIS